MATLGHWSGHQWPPHRVETAREKVPGKFLSQVARWEDQLGSRSSACTSTSGNDRRRISSEEGLLAETVEALDLLVQQGTYVDCSRFYSLLKRCILQNDLVLGRRLHVLIVNSGYESNTFLANHVICMYSSHGRLEEANLVFTKVASPDAHMWASIILAHARHGQPTQAIRLYRQVRQSTVRLDNRIFVSVLKACSSAADLISGKEVHADILATRIKPDKFVGSCLVDMYAKCGKLEDARRVFDTLTTRDVVTWNAMIAGYARHGLGEEALAIYARMQHDGITPADHVTFVCLLQACASDDGGLNLGKQLHAQIRQRKLDADVVVGNCLMHMYAKCGSLENARKVFDALPTKSVVTWTTMMAAYAQHGLGKDALSLYTSMRQEGMTPPDHVTLASLLQACASVGALRQGREIHSQIQETAALADVVLGTSLVDMYSKCGRLEDAHKVFDTLPRKDVVTWNALLNGYAQICDSRMALQCFEEMRQQGIQPNSATFICLLVACSHGGLVNEGHQYIRMMEDYGIVPTVCHYNCIVDLLGRSGHLDDAEEVLRTMPVANDIVGWTSLLTACKSHGDIERGTRCFEHLTQLEPESASPYVLMASIYSNAGRWGDMDRIESMKQFAGAKKKPARACIELNKEVHEFMVGDERGAMSSKLRIMNTRLKEEGGHVPQTELVLTAVSEEEKEDALCGHAEKLALAYGLMNTVDGTPLLVTKNLRMCNDCHSSTKILSHLEKREIVVRDAHRVHRFQDGTCSCGDLH